MEISLTKLDQSERLIIPMLPEAVSVKTSARFYTYETLSMGSIMMPSGDKISSISWQGILPGPARAKQSFVNISYNTPRIIQSYWSKWRADGVKLRLLITETPINLDVFLESYNIEFFGGYGDYKYDINFIIAKELSVYLDGERKNNLPTRPEPASPTSYTVKEGDTLWAIAQKFLGSGSRYLEIHAINQPPLGRDPNLILVNQVLKIPV